MTRNSMSQQEVQVTDNTEQLDAMAAMSDEDFLNSLADAESKQLEESKEPDEKVTDTQEVKSTEEVTAKETTESVAAVPPVVGQASDEINYKEFYERVTKPFKANGREIVVTNPDDLITLAQKGTDYVKKMTELKPLKRINKLLQDNGIAEDDLAYLIDLKAKKPEAIAKLLKDSEVDLYQFDVEQGNDYKPVAPTYNEVNEELTNVLDDLEKNSSTFKQTIAVIGQQWDEHSRNFIAQNPNLVRIIDAQIANGAFAKIDTIMQYERAVGRLDGMTDLEAYVAIEKQLAAKQTVPPVVTQQQQQPSKPSTVDARRQAAPPRQTKTDTPPLKINSPALSDADFLKELAKAGY
ncbi:hypothetical protein [uncultured Flavobacterium sp.]|uniref:hypothetical protein n=1 Tax=uncultured Flavobacterium sp. TaxID=165435 RepID=UPI0025998CCC|nr:hypothetical protein [uncultured Flavobacterium sp.]